MNENEGGTTTEDRAGDRTELTIPKRDFLMAKGEKGGTRKNWQGKEPSDALKQVGKQRIRQ